MPRKSKRSLVPITEALNTIYKQSKGSGLQPELFSEIKNEVYSIGQYLGSNEEEAFMFAVVCAMNLFGEEVESHDLIRFFDVTPFELVNHLQTLNTLSDKGLLVRQKNRRRFSEGLRKYHFIVAPAILNAILNHQPMPKEEVKEISDVVEVLEKINDFCQECISENMDANDLYVEVNETLEKYKHFPFIAYVIGLDLTHADRIVYTYVVWKSINGCLSVDMDEPINSFFRRSSNRVQYLQGIYNGSNKLIKYDLVEFSSGRFFNDLDFILSDKSLTLLQENGLTVVKRKSSKNAILPENIAQKELFYEAEEKAQVDDLRAMMEEERYANLMQRLSSKALPQNLNILLFGAPGTGKTETVYQLAKASGREIMKVEISQSKSMWFGESEKLIKKIFKDYTELAAHTVKAPILLFNEADAILSSRKSRSNSPVSQTENAMQNILLEELENFKGIFIATTNLAENLDKAFDRRFLYKIEFHRPGLAARAGIWKSKLPELTDGDAEAVANEYDLTGGQIDNVVRKLEVQRILHESPLELDYILKLCAQEVVLQKGINRIGFGGN